MTGSLESLIAELRRERADLSHAMLVLCDGEERLHTIDDELEGDVERLVSLLAGDARAIGTLGYLDCPHDDLSAEVRLKLMGEELDRPALRGMAEMMAEYFRAMGSHVSIVECVDLDRPAA